MGVLLGFGGLVGWLGFGGLSESPVLDVFVGLSGLGVLVGLGVFGILVGLGGFVVNVGFTSSVGTWMIFCVLVGSDVLMAGMAVSGG